MDQTQRENAIFKIDGYFLPDNYLTEEGRFLKAQGELLENLDRDRQHASEITFDQFKKGKR